MQVFFTISGFILGIANTIFLITAFINQELNINIALNLISAILFDFGLIVIGNLINRITKIENHLNLDDNKGTDDKYSDNSLPQIKCPNCGNLHDFDYPKCPYCGYFKKG